MALLGFLAYMVAEELQLSGIFSIFFAGITMRWAGGAEQHTLPCSRHSRGSRNLHAGLSSRKQHVRMTGR